MKMVRQYDKYDDYIKHQTEKTLDPLRIEKWKTLEWESKISSFSLIFQRHKNIIGEHAICLGARTGQEVEALRRMNIKAIGVDLVEFPPLVIAGDVHDLLFDDSSFTFVFSNIFDHVLYPDKFISEIERILKDGGHCLLHIQSTKDPDEYAENIVDDLSDIVSLFKNSDIVQKNKIFCNSFLSYDRELIMRKRLWTQK